MLASYLLSRTLVPTLAMYLLRAKEHGAACERGSSRAFSRGLSGF
jgi:multidrug efflux pump subunit AcrB